MSDLHTALAVAYRHFNDAGTTDRERDAILQATSEFIGGPDGERAARLLHHRTQAASLQLELTLSFAGRTPRAP